jgi:hypothetical protein
VSDRSIHAQWLSKGGSSRTFRCKYLKDSVLVVKALTQDRGAVSHVGTRNLNYSKTLSAAAV